MAVRFGHRGLTVGRCHVSVRNLVVMWILLFFVCGWFFFMVDHRPAGCRHEDMLQYVCRYYSKGVITGKMCPRLCQGKEFVFTRCLSRSLEHQVYEVEVRQAKSLIKDRYLVHWTHDPKDGDYQRPADGSSMEDLRHMLSAFLKLRLGEGDFGQFQTKIFDVADINNDGKVSLAEAKTLWGLLRGNDFLLLMALSKSEVIPKLEGFCGDIYVTEGVQVYDIYGPNQIHPGMLGSFFSGDTLSWAQGAHIVLGVIEFVEEIIDNPLGNFLMCSVTPRSIGYTRKHDAKLLNLQDISPEVKVEGELKERMCQTDIDCIYGSNCQSPCDMASHKCQSEVTYPNLYKMCQLLEPVLFNGIPAEIKDKLRLAIDRCKGLRHSGRKMDMEHSLVINDIKGVIWRQISDSNS
ncbi:divergent protein kinase domain 1A-like [Lytechinus pictus]|uniref:divergent protein kinase domain 1A-like n=1 Tax=Lytechinus pictus TaxID=7653 RepID=UPI00240DA6B0|nr:divergent protein kinase domain 1A-like [Lytechinus pictus]